MQYFFMGIGFTASLFVLHLGGFRLLGKNAHPLGFLIWIQIFSLTIVGVISLSIFKMPMAYGSEAAISDETRETVLQITLWSIIFLFLGLALLFKLRILTPLKYTVRRSDIDLLGKLTLISFTIIFIKLISVSEIPFVLMLHGDLLGAIEAKISILTKQTGITFFGFNYIVRSFPSYVYIAAILTYLAYSENAKCRNLLYINTLLASVDSLYDLQKQSIVLLALSTFWILYIQNGKFLVLIKGVVIASVFAAAMLMVTLGDMTSNEILEQTINRIFIAQAEGMFFIVQLIGPSTKYVWLGFPLASLFGLAQLDPAAEVIPILFPSVSDAWLNSNTYYIAHAWTIFEEFAIVVGPLFILLNILAILLMTQPLVSNGPVIYYALVFWLIIKMPVANIFTEFFNGYFPAPVAKFTAQLIIG